MLVGEKRSGSSLGTNLIAFMAFGTKNGPPDGAMVALVKSMYVKRNARVKDVANVSLAKIIAYVIK